MLFRSAPGAPGLYHRDQPGGGGFRRIDQSGPVSVEHRDSSGNPDWESIHQLYVRRLSDSGRGFDRGGAVAARPIGHFEVMLRFTNPLPEYFNNLRRHVHTGLCLHARPASTRCSPRSGSVRNGNWSKQRCPWGGESPRAKHRVPPPCGLASGCLTVLGGHVLAKRFPWGKPWDRQPVSGKLRRKLGVSPGFAAYRGHHPMHAPGVQVVRRVAHDVAGGSIAGLVSRQKSGP